NILQFLHKIDPREIRSRPYGRTCPVDQISDVETLLDRGPGCELMSIRPCLDCPELHDDLVGGKCENLLQPDAQAEPVIGFRGIAKNTRFNSPIVCQRFVHTTDSETDVLRRNDGPFRSPPIGVVTLSVISEVLDLLSANSDIAVPEIDDKPKAWFEPFNPHQLIEHAADFVEIHIPSVSKHNDAVVLTQPYAVGQLR